MDINIALQILGDCIIVHGSLAPAINSGEKNTGLFF